MLCVTCLEPAESLYVTYSNRHIQLTQCNYCHKPVDKYVERDNVILFIDLLLLKPGAYRHLVFNTLESNLDKYTDMDKGTNGIIMNKLSRWWNRFDFLNRLWILLLTFEIYLKCATEESRYSQMWKSAAKSNISLDLIHMRSAQFQYIYFTLYSLLDILLFHNLIQYAVIGFYNWGHDVKYAKQVVSYTILLSYGAKIFPVLMLIWPYDTIISMDIIKGVANLYIIESLRIVTNLSYWKIIRIFLTATLIRIVVVRLIMILFLTGGNLPLAINHIMNTMWTRQMIFL
ncbi:similar to Saccharomyces cerevisiae YLR242C ARV1 Protein functioning in transport of glycosylphosphatidylinositol intermediates into ER lumen [Maudiozyma saulgeensis]|uniref:Protein ARV n=1 Tax=Maudiozyma saulgeensis TaxID=1789683 RepID=A0A1X7RAV4_9SACH|nr:similar to Saccharomyces cerevisiae YLR242C ARV1 Protein functioning in transport of glycosylphosphatidylinositol intermediates into ER lumen [Kazachstania saulgeensis]